jgi:hypothetical protein
MAALLNPSRAAAPHPTTARLTTVHADPGHRDPGHRDAAVASAIGAVHANRHADPATPAERRRPSGTPDLPEMPPIGTVDGWVVLVLPPELGRDDTARLDRRVLTLMRHGMLRLVLDLTATSWPPDLFGLIVSTAWRRAQLRGGRLRLVASTPAHRDALRALRLPGPVHVFPTVVSALAAA